MEAPLLEKESLRTPWLPAWISEASSEEPFLGWSVPGDEVKRSQIIAGKKRSAKLVVAMDETFIPSSF